MKLKEFDFNSIKSFLGITGLCIKEEGASVLDPNRAYSGFIGDVLKIIPTDWAERDIKESRWYFNEFVIELKK